MIYDLSCSVIYKKYKLPKQSKTRAVIIFKYSFSPTFPWTSNVFLTPIGQR